MSAAWPRTNNTRRFSLNTSLRVAQVILEREQFTLEELLEEEDLIQECKSLNSRLITLYERGSKATQAKALRIPPNHPHIAHSRYYYPTSF